MAVRFCHKCGTQLADTSRFCFNCGTPIAAPAAPTPAPAAPVAPVTPVTPVPAPDPFGFAPDPFAPYTPAVQETPVPEVVPAVAPIPVAEPAPAIEPIPVVEPIFASEPAPVAEPAPVEEPVPVAEPIPVIAPVPAAEPTPAVEPIFAADPAPAAEPVPVAEPAPAVPPVAPPVAPVQDPFGFPQQNSYTPPVAPYVPPVTPPAPPSTAKPPKTPKPKKEKAPMPKRHGGIAFLSVFLCCILVILSIATVLLMDVRNLVTEEGITGLLNDVKLDEIYAEDIIDAEDVGGKKLDKWYAARLENKYKNCYAEGYCEWNTLDAKAVSKLFGRDYMQDFLAETAVTYVEYIVENESDPILEQKDILKFLQSNRSDLYKDIGLSYADSSAMEQLAQAIVDINEFEDFSASTLEEEAPAAYAAVRYGLNDLTFTIAIVVVCLFVLLVVLTNLKKPLYALKDLSGTLITVAAILLAVTLFGYLLPMFTDNGINGMAYLAGLVLQHLTLSGLVVTLVILGVGIVMKVTEVVIRKIKYAN